MKLIHGGDWAGYQREYGRIPLDFSQNVSPLGMPQGVKNAAIHSIEHADRYPDPLCRALRAAIGVHYGVPGEWILCGNGAADLIWRSMAALGPKEILLPAPGFHEYEAAAAAVGSQVAFYALPEDADFRLGEEILEQITPELDAAVLCQPNNPTGQVVDPELLGRILARCRDCGTLLILDECFLELLPDPEGRTLIPHLAGGGLLILRAFTKSYAMAGLRLGFCLCADTVLLERMRSAGQPWPVSTVAQAAGIAALEEQTYLADLRRLIQTQRPILEEGLCRLGCRVVPGQGNFILFRAEDHQLAEKLKERGILIRSCENFRGLGPGWYRIAVRKAQENAQLLAALKEVAKAWQNV